MINKLKFLRLPCMAVAVLLWASWSHATTYKYVSPDGSDSSARDGGQAQPWKTLNYALSRISNDCVVTVYGSGDPGNPYVLRETETTNVVRSNVRVIAPDRDVRIDGTLIGARGASLYLSGTNNYVEGFQIVGGDRAGVILGSSNGDTLSNCQIFDNPGNGMFIWSASTSIVTGCDIYNNGYMSNGDITHGIYIARDCNSVTIENSRIRDNAESGIHCNGNDHSVNSDIHIIRNQIYGNGGKATDLQNTHDSSFENNLVYSNNSRNDLGAGVITLDSDDNDSNGNLGGATGSIRNVVANNTILSSNKGRAIWLVAPTFYVNPVGAEDCKVFNNIIMTPSGTGAIDDDGVNNQIGSNYLVTYGSSALNSVFEAYQNNNYMILEGSPAYEAAVTSFAGVAAPAIDLLGNNRVAPLDLGAYERSVPQGGFAVTVFQSGDGSVTRTPDKVLYNSGESVSLTAVPSTGWEFSGWTGDLSGTANPSTITVNGNTSITAVFTAELSAPLAPQGLTVVVQPDNSVSLTWSANSESDLAGYWVYWGASSVAGGATNYADSANVGLNTEYQISDLAGRVYFAVRAYNNADLFSPYSTEKSLYVVGPTPSSAFQISYWNMDEGTGDAAADAWGNKNASLVDGAGWATSGAVAGAIALDGVNDRAEIAGLDIPDGPGMSIALWCNADDFGTPDARLISKATGTAEQSHYWMVSTIDQTGLRFRLRTDGQTATVQTAAGQLQAGRWYHIAAVYDGAFMRLYKDGVQVASSAKTGIVDVNASIAAAIGNQPTGAGTLAFDGRIDDVRIYRRPLTSADIATLIALRTNAAPVASFTASTTTGTAPVEVTFNASASSDPDGDPLTFSWDFDDGGTASGVTANHTYSLAGTYDAVLTVSDDHNNSDTQSVIINVGEQTTPPSIPSLQLVLEDDPGCVTVTWLPNGEPDLAGYTLYYGTASVEGGEAGAYDENVVLGALTSWRSCSFGPGRYYVALRARNDAGQLSGYSSEVALDVAGPDVVGPTIIPLDPSSGASNVALQASVRFVVLDDRSSVDTQNLTVRINGQVPADVQLQPDAPGYSVTCVPASAFPPNSQVVVDVTARDTAAQPNTGTRSWSFRTVSVPPAAPVGLTATGSTVGELSLGWGANQESDLAGYRLYFGPAPRNYTDSLSVGLINSYTVGGLADGTYYVALRARNAAGQTSGLSAEASAVVTNPVATGPTPPQGVQVTESAPGCMRVTWQANSDPEVSGYFLFYSTLSVAQGETSVYFNTVDARNTTSYEICNLTTSTYYVALRAYRDRNDPSGYSGYSTEKNVEVAAPDQVAPTVTLAYPGNGAVGVPQNVKAFLLFSDDDSGIDTTAVTIRIGNQIPSRISFTGDPYRLGAVCDLDEPLPASSVVSVDVTVADLADSPNTTTRSWSFTTGNAADLVPPVFVSFSPADGSRDIDPSVDIVIQIQDDNALDAARTQLFVDGDEVEVTTEDAGGGRLNVRRRQATLLPAGEIDVRVVAYDTADNRSELLFDFTVSGFGPDLASSDPEGAIVPDGFWADDPDRPLEIRNLPLGWTVRIFTTAGVQVRSYENAEEDGMTWIWDFHNDYGQEVARALYLVRVVDGNGNVQQSGKFIARLTQ